MGASSDDDYEVMPSDIAFEWFLAGVTPEEAERDRLPPDGTTERRRVDQLKYGREYYYNRQARLTDNSPQKEIA